MFNQATRTVVPTKQPLPVMNKWHFVIRFHPAWNRREAMEMAFGFFRIFKLPPPGEMLTSKNYNGFLFTGSFNNPAFVFSFNVPTYEEVLAKMVKTPELSIGVDLGSDEGDTTVMAEKTSDGEVKVVETKTMAKPYIPR